MDRQAAVKKLLARYETEFQFRQEPLLDAGSLHAELPLAKLAFEKTAAGFPPPQFQKGGGGDFPPGGDAEGGSGKRNIPSDHPFDPRSLKPMSKALWASSVSLGHALTAYRFLSRLKSATISPDGMLGGRGYVMAVTDLRKKLYDACESLSCITDTLHDEVTAPHWKPRLAQLDTNEAEDVERFVEESQGILENPGEDAEEEATEIEEENDDDLDEEESEDKANESASEMPSGGSPETSQAEPMGTAPTMKQASTVYSYDRRANSSIPVGALPGPRVEHIDREDAESINPPGATPNDAWGAPGQREYDYPSPWDNDLREAGGSGMPVDTTPTDGWDFGLGYGAKGDGAGGYENPSGEGNNKGVWGPHSGLPGSPAGSSGDTTPALDSATSRHEANGMLPGDTDRPVARSDYYRGDKGNLVNTQSVLPSEPAPKGEMSPGLMNTDYVTEDISTPYVRLEDTVHEYRQDPLHDWPDNKVNEHG